MSNSLQDQLLKAGLVSQSQLNKAKKGKSKKSRQRDVVKKEAQDKQIKDQIARQEKLARDRDLNQKVIAKQQRNARVSEIKQLIERNEISETGGEVSFNFQHGRRIKQINVKPDCHRKLIEGKAAIVRFDGAYRVVPTEVLVKITERDANLFTFVASPSDDSGTDHEYAGYEVPDDLQW